MRYIRYVFLAALAAVLVTFALANREIITMKTLPEGLLNMPGASMASYSVQVPVFLVLLFGIALGLAIGFVWEWMREHKHRADASRKKSEVRKLERELRRVKGQRDEGKDEVLALLDEAS